MMAKDGDDRAQRLERERESLEARVRDQTVKIQGLTSQLAEARISQTKSQQAEQQVQEVRFVCVCFFLTVTQTLIISQTGPGNGREGTSARIEK